MTDPLDDVRRAMRRLRDHPVAQGHRVLVVPNTTLNRLMELVNRRILETVGPYRRIRARDGREWWERSPWKKMATRWTHHGFPRISDGWTPMPIYNRHQRRHGLKNGETYERQS